MGFNASVKMLPWVGKDYGKQEKKVLIVGESVYGEGYASKKRIVNMIDGIRNEKWTHPYYTKIMKVFNMNKRKRNYDSTYTPDKEEFWDSVACWEYVQHVMTEPKEKVIKEYWEGSGEALENVCSVLRPDIILCIGKETYRNFPKYGEPYREIGLPKVDKTMSVWKYDKKMKSKKVINPMYVCCISHPSAPGFNNKEWYDLYTKFLQSIS